MHTNGRRRAVLASWLLVIGFAAAILIIVVAVLCVSGCRKTPDSATRSEGLQIVAAENFWGSLISQLAGPHARVVSIVSDPNADPHEYSSSVLVRFSLPGSPAQFVHFVLVATARAASIASHSSGETTATKFPFFTTSAVGNCFLLISPVEISVEPRAAGLTIRACNMPGKVTSQLH